MFDDQNFVFKKTGTDTSGRNIYVTTPLDPGQDCSGLGTCEFKFQWNSSTSKWEFWQIEEWRFCKSFSYLQ